MMTGRRESSVAEGFVTRREAAEMAGVHPNTIRLWESTGRVSAKKRADGVVLIPRAEIEEIITQRVVPRTDAEKVAALEAENRELRRQNEELLERYDRLLQSVLDLTHRGGEDPTDQ
jgi:DNA-binding transcriptional MerR regulator